MDRWILYAFASMVFAGLTAAVAKPGLAGISAELGLALRTVFVFGFILLFAAVFVDSRELANVTWTNVTWLLLSAAATAISWVFYYKAIKLGEVSTVAIIDKGSFLIAVFAAWLLLGERITWRIAGGSALILAGLLVVSRRTGA